GGDGRGQSEREFGAPDCKRPAKKTMTAVAVGAPAARRLRQLDFILLASYWVAIGYLWQSLGTLILPDMVLHLVGPTVKGTALSALEGMGTVMAIVWQPMMGAVAARTRSRLR